MKTIADKDEQFRRLCEFNVIEQVRNVCNTTIIKDAWKRGQELTVHGLIYRLTDGSLENLNLTVQISEEFTEKYATAVKELKS